MFFNPPPTHYSKYYYDNKLLREFGELKTYAGYYVIFAESDEIKKVPYNGFSELLREEKVLYTFKEN